MTQLAADIVKGARQPLDLLFIDLFNGKDDIPSVLCSSGAHLFLVCNISVHQPLSIHCLPVSEVQVCTCILLWPHSLSCDRQVNACVGNAEGVKRKWVHNGDKSLLLGSSSARGSQKQQWLLRH